MTQVSIYDARNRLSALVEEVERGAEITITRRGKVVAKLVAAGGSDRAAAAATGLLALRSQIAARGEIFQTMMSATTGPKAGADAVRPGLLGSNRLGSPQRGDPAIRSVAGGGFRPARVGPSFWAIEIANVLLIAERRNRITSTERQGALQFFAELPVTLEETVAGRVWSDTMALAGQHRLTIYDALDLEASLRHGLPLATLDSALTAAAEACGVTVLGR